MCALFRRDFPVSTISKKEVMPTPTPGLHRRNILNGYEEYFPTIFGGVRK
jgi:hypothetical protein